MHLVVIAWLYVALMMAVAEATNTTGTVLGAVFTFLLYGLAPVALVVYLMGTPARRRAIKAREAAERQSAPRRISQRQMQAAKRPLTRSRRCEKKRDGLATVHHARLPSLPWIRVMPSACSRWRARPGRSASHLPLPCGLKQSPCAAVVRDEGRLHLGADLECVGPDAGAEPGHQFGLARTAARSQALDSRFERCPARRSPASPRQPACAAARAPVFGRRTAPAGSRPP